MNSFCNSYKMMAHSVAWLLIRPAMFGAFSGLQIFSYTFYCEFQRERKYGKRMTVIMLIIYDQINYSFFFGTVCTAHNNVKIILSGIHNSCKHSTAVYKRGYIKTF